MTEIVWTDEMQLAWREAKPSGEAEYRAVAAVDPSRLVPLPDSEDELEFDLEYAWMAGDGRGTVTAFCAHAILAKFGAPSRAVDPEGLRMAIYKGLAKGIPLSFDAAAHDATKAAIAFLNATPVDVAALEKAAHKRGRADATRTLEAVQDDRDRWKHDCMQQAATINRMAAAVEDRNKLDALLAVQREADIVAIKRAAHDEGYLAGCRECEEKLRDTVYQSGFTAGVASVRPITSADLSDAEVEPLRCIAIAAYHNKDNCDGWATVVRKLAAEFTRPAPPFIRRGVVAGMTQAERDLMNHAMACREPAVIYGPELAEKITAVLAERAPKPTPLDLLRKAEAELNEALEFCSIETARKVLREARDDARSARMAAEQVTS